MSSRITVKQGKRSGQPCIRGLRITVWDVLSWLADDLVAEAWGLWELRRVDLKKVARLLREQKRPVPKLALGS